MKIERVVTAADCLVRVTVETIDTETHSRLSNGTAAQSVMTAAQSAVRDELEAQKRKYVDHWGRVE